MRHAAWRGDWPAISGPHLLRDLRQEVAGLARRLRTTAPEAYADDGALTSRAAYQTQAVFDLLSDAERSALEAAARGQDAVTAASALAEIRRRLLDGFLNARARSSVVATMPAVEALLQRAADAADRGG